MRGIGRQLSFVPPTAALSGRCALVVLAIAAASGMARAGDLQASVEQANSLLKQGKADEALALYGATLEREGANAPAELVYDNACALLAANKLPEAEAAFRSILAHPAKGELGAGHSHASDDHSKPESEMSTDTSHR